MKYNFNDLLETTMNPDVKPSTELNQSILQKNREEKLMNKSNTNKKVTNITSRMSKIVAATCIGILTTGGAALAATHLWNSDVARIFGVEEDDSAMQQLNEQGFSAIPVGETENNTLSVTDKDITVTVLQTVADEHNAYIYFQAEFAEQYTPVLDNVTALSDTGLAFAVLDITADSGLELNYCGGVEEIKDDHTIIYSYQIAPCEGTFSDTTINLSVNEFTMDQVKMDETPTVLAKGNWNLSWNLSNGHTKRIYDINKEISLGEYDFTVKSLEISPLSYKVYVENSDNFPLFELEAVLPAPNENTFAVDKNGNWIVHRYVKANMETEDAIIATLPENETLIPLGNVSAFYLGEKTFDGTNGMSGCGLEDNEKYSTDLGTFSQILDLDELTGFQIAGHKIDLTDCTYETVNSFE